MADALILLPGWGLGCAALQPLADVLPLAVRIEPLPVLDHAFVDAWLDELDQRLPQGVWLGGWSLGGMLASLLAARRGQACAGLVSMASNCAFVASPAWLAAMPSATFTAFRQAYGQNPAATLKRFAMLCSQGAGDTRGLSRQLLDGADGSDSAAGLALLAELDTLAALKAFSGPQLHLFAAADALVTVAASAALQAAVPGATVEIIEGASHAMPVEQAEQLAHSIHAFMEAPR